MLKPYINGTCAKCKYASTDMVCHYDEDAPIKDCCDIGECDVYEIGEYAEPTTEQGEKSYE